jgi:hypothetical protein
MDDLRLYNFATTSARESHQVAVEFGFGRRLAASLHRPRLRLARRRGRVQHAGGRRRRFGRHRPGPPEHADQRADRLYDRSACAFTLPRKSRFWRPTPTRRKSSSRPTSPPPRLASARQRDGRHPCQHADQRRHGQCPATVYKTLSGNITNPTLGMELGHAVKIGDVQGTPATASGPRSRCFTNRCARRSSWGRARFTSITAAR